MSNLRTTVKDLLKEYIKKEANLNIFEKRLWDVSSSEDEYKQFCYDALYLLENKTNLEELFKDIKTKNFYLTAESLTKYGNTYLNRIVLLLIRSRLKRVF